MYRKLRRPTPNFKIPPPFNPISGEHKDLENQGVHPYCAMMQIAAEDTYDDYVVCRGFDTRILKFVDYEEGNSDKPGISVAKPFGCRGGSDSKVYRIGQIFPAFLPTQGTADFVPDYVPPSPIDVKWRLGQNPGFVDGGTDFGGHPEELTDTVSMLMDHNDKVINWMFIHSNTARHFRFQSQDDLSGTSVEACVRQMTGEDAHIATIYDPDQIFLGMLAGTKGLVFFQDGKYYIVQAKCDPDTLESCV
jgi:hypothetical protein